MKSLLLSTLLTCFILCSAAIAQPVFEPPLGQPINFPDTDVGNVSRLGLMVMGAGQMWNLQFEVNDQSFSVEPPQRNVGAREAFEFELRFTPQREGQIQAIMTVVTIGENGDAFAFEVQMSGTGIGGDRPEIAVDPEEVRLEIETPEQQESFTIVVSNGGNEVLEIAWELDEVEWVFLRDDRSERNLNPGSNENIRFRTTHDFPENGEHVANLTISSNDPDRPEIVVPITLIVDIPEITTLTIELDEGWNMISSNREFAEDFIDDEGPDIQLIFGDIIEQISHIKDGFGRFCSPEFDFWGIESWEIDQGYQVRTLEETELEVTGTVIPWDREIFLHGGWNIVPYYPTYNNWSLREALNNLIERDLLRIAKDAYGRFIIPEFIFQDPPANPGQGYQVKVTQNCRFTWAPEPDWLASEQLAPQHQRLLHFDFDLETAHSSNNMSVVIRNIEADNEVPDGAEIACYTRDGKIAGAGIFRNSSQAVCLAVWGEEKLTEDEVEGLAIGESLTFRMWDPVRDEEYPLSVSVVEGEDSYSENGILICDGKAETTNTQVTQPCQFEVTALYPNPFNSNLTVNYNIFEPTDIQIGLFSIDGRLLKNLIPQEKTVGNHAITMDASDLSAGIYVIKVGSGDRVLSSKVVLLK